MKFGLRLQLLLVLGAFLGLSFVPLHFAISASAEFGLRKSENESAIELARGAAEQLGALRTRLEPDELRTQFGHRVETGNPAALFALDPEGSLVAAAGRLELMDRLRGKRDLSKLCPSERLLHLDAATFACSSVTSAEGRTLALVRIERDHVQPARLARLVALFMATTAIVVLAFAYYFLTRVVVRPLLELESSAERIAGGARNWTTIARGAPEMVHLGHSLRTMTSHLRDEEDRLRDKIRELEEARVELARAQNSLVRSERLATVGRLSAGLAHEIGNPLSALVGFVDLLDQGGLTPEEIRDFHERMRKELSRIHRVLHDLLTYARAGSQEGPDEETGNYTLAVQSVTSLLAPQKDLHDLRLEIEFPRDLPPCPLSSEKLTQVLLNLAINAAHATEGKGRLVLGATHRDSTVTLCVEDDGPGIAPNVASRIFEPFVTTKDPGKGTGLGLSVTRDLVESCGGTIEVGPSPLGGARFVLQFPVPKALSTEPD